MINLLLYYVQYQYNGMELYWVQPSASPSMQGYSHIKANGDVPTNRSLFYKKSLNMGPVFLILKHGPNFLTEPKFSGFCMVKTPKIAKCVDRPIFQEKSLTMGTLFCQNDP